MAADQVPSLAIGDGKKMNEANPYTVRHMITRSNPSYFSQQISGIRRSGVDSSHSKASVDLESFSTIPDQAYQRFGT